MCPYAVVDRDLAAVFIRKRRARRSWHVSRPPRRLRVSRAGSFVWHNAVFALLHRWAYLAALVAGVLLYSWECYVGASAIVLR